MTAEQFTYREQSILIRRRPYKRTIHLAVKFSGQVQVSASSGTSLENIIQFLEQHWLWISKMQNKYALYRNAHPSKNYQEGERYLFLGQERVLKFQVARTNKPRAFVDDEVFVVEIPKHISLTLNEKDRRALVKKSMSLFYRRQAQNLLTSRVQFWSMKMKLFPQKITIRQMRTRWGSCGSNGHISLNWRLLAAPFSVIDYIVIHELAHLKHPNHSAHFWSLVESYIPDYKTRRSWIKKNQFALDFLNPESEIHTNDENFDVLNRSQDTEIMV